MPRAKRTAAQKGRRQQSKQKRRRLRKIAERDDTWRLVAARLCRRGRVRSDLTTALQDGKLSRAEAGQALREDWAGFITSIGNAPASAEAVLSVLHLWQDWPGLYWLCRQAADPWTADQQIALDLLHTGAESILRREAARRGLDSATLAFAGEHCRAVLAEHPELGQHVTWPDLLAFVGRVDPPDARSRIDRAVIALADRLASEMEGGSERSRLRPRANETEGEPLPLSDCETKVFDILRALPQGKAIGLKALAEDSGVGEKVLTAHTIPFLKKHYGVRNRRNVGYYIDPQGPQTT